jgi:integrase
MTLGNLTWESFLAYLLYELKFGSKTDSVSSLKSRFTILQRFFQDRDFTQANLRLFFMECDKRKIKNSTKNKFIAMASHIGHYLNLPEWDKKIKYFREVQKVIPSKDLLTVEEMLEIKDLEINYKKYKNFLNHRNSILCWLIAVTGCRISEALDLTQDLVTSDEDGGWVLFTNTKTGVDREDPIPKDLYDLIKELTTDGLIFISARSKSRLRTQEVCLDWKRRAKILGIHKNITSHLYRHSYITRLLEAHADVMGVAQLVGHRNPRTTMRYNHSSRSYLNDVALNDPLRKSELTYERGANKAKEFIKKNINDDMVTPVIHEDERGTSIFLPKY